MLGVKQGYQAVKQGYQAWSYNGEPMILKLSTADDHRSADSQSRPDVKVSIKVLFTNQEATLQALRRAQEFSRGLKAHILLIAANVVRFELPLDRPPVPVSFTQKALSDLVRRTSDKEEDISVEVYLCRDKLHTLLRVLEPHSTVVVGGRKRWWWPTAESRLAQKLRTAGHEVIFATTR